VSHHNGNSLVKFVTSWREICFVWLGRVTAKLQWMSMKRLGKVKVKSLCLAKHHAMKTYWGVEVQLHAFLAWALDGSEWSTSRPGRFTPRERAPGTHWIGGWVGPRGVLNAVVKRKIPSPRQESDARTPIFQPVAQRHTDWAITALVCKAPIEIFFRLYGRSFNDGPNLKVKLMNLS
jgi:hypothetical protein